MDTTTGRKEPWASWPSGHPLSRISYRAIVAGVLVALITQVVLMVLGGAIGLTAMEPDRDVAKGVGIGMSVWTVISVFASSLCGAYCAASVAQCIRRRDGMLHGIVTWAATSLIGLMFVGSALSQAIGGALGFAGQAAQSPAIERMMPRGEMQRRMQGREMPTEREQSASADKAATGTAIGLWGLLLAHLFGFGGALVGGTAGAKSEAKRAGYDPDYDRERKRITRERFQPPTPTTPAPTPT